jgi:hypothetical protein
MADKRHVAGVPTDLEGDQPKRSLRGAAGGVYIGPARINSTDTNTAHATGAAGTGAGGVEDSTGYRKRDGYDGSGATGGGVGFGDASVTTESRPNGGSVTYKATTSYIADGVQGGSVPGRPIASGTTHLLAGNFDKRATTAGEGGRALGSSGRGTQYKVGTADPVQTGTAHSRPQPNTLGLTVVAPKLIPAPLIQAGNNPAAGTVTIGTGTAAGILVDAHADDVTGGTNGRAGYEVFVFKRSTDTDEDGSVRAGYLRALGSQNPGAAGSGAAAGLVKKFDVDSATEADVSAGLAASTTYSVYARFKNVAGDGSVGPMSARTTVLTHA